MFSISEKITHLSFVDFILQFSDVFLFLCVQVCRSFQMTLQAKKQNNEVFKCLHRFLTVAEYGNAVHLCIAIKIGYRDVLMGTTGC